MLGYRMTCSAPYFFSFSFSFTDSEDIERQPSCIELHTALHGDPSAEQKMIGMELSTLIILFSSMADDRAITPDPYESIQQATVTFHRTSEIHSDVHSGYLSEHFENDSVVSSEIDDVCYPVSESSMQ